MLSVVPEARETSDATAVLPPDIEHEFERLVADLNLTGAAAAAPDAGVRQPQSAPLPAPPALPASASHVRSWRQIFADDPGLLVTCGVMGATVLVVVVAWLHVLSRLDAVERRAAPAGDRAAAAARAAIAAPDALRTAIDVQRMMRVQSALDVVQLTARAGAGGSSVQGHLWWSPSVGLAMWARPVPIPADAQLGYHAWLVTEDGTDYLGPVSRDGAGTITASFDPPRHATSKVTSVLVALQPADRLDRPGDMVVLEARF
jgi:hypothetical protein